MKDRTKLELFEYACVILGCIIMLLAYYHVTL